MLEYITKVNLRKAGLSGLFNLSMNYLECRTKPIKCISKPVTIMSEPTGDCNLKCKMCPRAAIDYKKQGSVDFEKWKEVMQKQFPYWHFHGFMGIGEPLLHPKFTDMIEYLEDRKVWKFVTTNATLLTDDKIKSLIKNNLNRMFISMDSSSKEMYETIRVGANFDKVCSNIKNLTNEIKKRKSKMEVILQSVLLKENAKDLPDMVRLASKLGVKEFRFQDIEIKFDTGWSTEEHAMRSNRSFFEKYIKEANKVGKELGVSVKFYNTSDYSLVRTKCVAPWNQAYIRWNGMITPCCTTLTHVHFFYGNIFEESFKDIWNNKKAMAFRKAARSKNQPKQCQKCSCL
ncbi:MAG: SPASM domain-containing protein [Candidatus Aenigmarchaeota archaeon]|nr:SPASM domain-containing protein [Candidatus Aenigmarchaeota archaeon]